MQFLVKHNGLVLSSGQRDKLQGEDRDRRNATKEQKTPCGTNLQEKWTASGDAEDVARYSSTSWDSIVLKRQGIKYLLMPMN